MAPYALYTVTMTQTPTSHDPIAGMLLSSLNDSQRAAAEATDGPVLVLAGAGTGKTRVLTTRLAYIIRTGRVRHMGEILAVTFTNKAAREMRERVAALLGAPAEGLWLGTFHALAARILRENADVLGLTRDFTILDTDDQQRLMKQLIQAAGVDDKKWPARAVLAAVQRWKDRGLTPDAVGAAEAGDLAGGRGVELYRAYQERLKTLNACDFGDLLLHNLTLFHAREDILKRYQDRFRYILVDEYQDTNVGQYLWLRLLARGHHNICCVGDDDQCVAAGTPVRMADGSEKPVEQVRPGDWVLSNYGRGEVRPARVCHTAERQTNEALVRITTESGRRLVSTAEHTHFADIVHSTSPQKHFTYLMEKRGIGFRLGTSQVYTKSQKTAVIGYQQRCLHEGADAIWLLETFETEADARECEHLLSLAYGITTFPFVARKGASENGLVHDQARLDRLHAQIESRKAALALLQHYGLRAEEPHHVPQSSEGRNGNGGRKTLHITLNAETRGPTPMHRIALSGTDPETRDRIKALGLTPRLYKRNPNNWRYETLFRDFAKIEDVRRQLSGVFDLTPLYKARLLKNRRALTLRPAAQIRPGMVMVNADGAPEVVTAVTHEAPAVRVHDLDIAGTHNFIAGGLVTHNSIYGWRGAEVGNILRFESDFPNARVIRLEKNYRSTAPILEAAGHLIAHNEGRLGKTLWTDEAAGEKVRVRGLWDGEAEARFIGEEIEDLQRKGHALGDIAILVRTGAQTRAFEERFLTLGLPYRVVGGPRFYERQEIRDALAYLRLIQSPDDDLAFERIVNVPKRGLGNKALQTLHTAARGRGTSLMRAAMNVVETEELRPAARRSLRGLLEAFGRWRRFVQDEGDHVALARVVLDESGYTEMWQQDKSVEAPGRLENLKELVQAMGEFDSLAGFLEHVSLVMEANTDSGGEMVTVMTLHGAKGLEFDTVFLAGWEQGLFPNQRALDEHGAKGLEEERRLAYVGLTRARRRAIVTFAANRRLYGNWNAAIPSCFIDELPRAQVEMESDPGLYSGGGLYGGGSQDSAAFGGFAESPSRWTPGMARAQARRGESTRFIEGTAEVIDATPANHGRGARIFHRKFGYGTVKSAEGERLTITFDQSGDKKVMAAFVVPAHEAD